MSRRKKKKSGNDKNIGKVAIITAILNLISSLISLLIKLIDVLDR